MKTIWFDMDGTLFDLYGVDEWLEKLRASDSTPYRDALPLIRFSHFARLVNALQRKGYRIGVISWLSKCGTPEYNLEVTAVKREVLKKRLPSVAWNEVHIVPYGTPKEDYCQDFEDILFDDEIQNRANWLSKGGMAFDEKNIIEILKKVLTNSCLYDTI